MTDVTLPPPDRFSIAGKLQPPAEHVALLVVGAGAAGCAASIEAARAGVSVMLVDENPVSAGLVGMDVPFYFGGRATNAVQAPERLVEQVLETNAGLAEAFEAGVDVRLSTSVWGTWVKGPGLNGLSSGLAGLADETKSWMVGFDRLIIATGARDLNFTFAGSDQPGVMGAQGFHALAARYNAFAGRRLVIVGSGGLALGTAEFARSRGLDVAALVEVRDEPQGPAERVAVLREGGVEILTGHVPLAAKGNADGVASLVVADRDDADRRREIACDTVVMAVGTVPAIELLDVLGARREMAPERGGHVPVVDEHGATSLAEVFVAGDCAGLGGDAETSGRRAGQAALRSLGQGGEMDAVGCPPAAAGRPAESEGLVYPLDWARALLQTGGEDVLACICEDVTRGDLLGVRPPRYLDWRSNSIARRDLTTLAGEGPVNPDQMKRLTRVCMGACQARRCREQVALVMAIGADVAPETVPLAGYRAPVRPLPLSVLADWEEGAEMDAGWNVWFGIATQWIGYEDIGTEREAEQLRAGMPY
ncbi:FAD-dependent oxidoreductase [Aurantimonas sp. VKM B-3413]|uniref:FAD-dependent oxidoreductase n=1 Tax=Aurantimonas sp. VKM B-3413 TaxID=2779401 RepID=UPI001E3485B0|nr:FAD-dependent oxidoreductase [Aurantimonas sp. VKM B-3413]MCB8836445.1 FAD-dependent oxidoreductase [Aurantimonas sp. VKM B-3413]